LTLGLSKWKDLVGRKIFGPKVTRTGSEKFGPTRNRQPYLTCINLRIVL